MSTVATRKDDKFFDFPWLLTDHKPISTVHISPVFNKYNVILEKKKKRERNFKPQLQVHYFV